MAGAGFGAQTEPEDTEETRFIALCIIAGVGLLLWLVLAPFIWIPVTVAGKI